MHKRELYIGWYLVAFVDVLGQQDLLREMRGLPEKTDWKQMAEFKTLLKKTVGTVKALRDNFHNFFEGMESHNFDLSEFTQKQKALYVQSKGNELKSHMFSDFVVLFLSLRDDVNKVPMSSVFATLASVASTFLMMLAGRHAIRGGIDIGVCVELEDKDIYGAALARAYKLESKTALYPRIVIGDELINYIQIQHNRPDDDIFTKLNKSMADICISLISVDDDGFPFLDYLGEGFKKYIGKDRLDPAIIEKAYEFVLNEWSKFKEKRDSSLAFRYTLLRDYFEHRLHLWQAK
jgi:hypothetical protein